MRHPFYIPPCFDDLDLENQKFVLEVLQVFINASVAKYVRGQKEHGGKLWERDCVEEAYLENIDQMWYLAGARRGKE